MQEGDKCGNACMCARFVALMLAGTEPETLGGICEFWLQKHFFSSQACATECEKMAQHLMYLQLQREVQPSAVPDYQGGALTPNAEKLPWLDSNVCCRAPLTGTEKHLPALMQLESRVGLHISVQKDYSGTGQDKSL